MTVRVSSAYGLLVRRNERTRAILEESRMHQERVLSRIASLRSDEHHEDDVHEWMALVDDGELMSVPAAMSPWDLESLLEQLRTEGLVHHEDFVVTCSGDGVADPMPSWLVEVEPRASYRLRRPDE